MSKHTYLTLVFKADRLSEEDRSTLVEKCSAASWSHAIDERKALEVELERYSMSAGAADQFRRESLAMRQALGFDKYRDDIAPVDLLNALDRRDAEVIEQMLSNMFRQKGMTVAHYKCTELVNWIRDYANQLRQQAKEVQS